MQGGAALRAGLWPVGGLPAPGPQSSLPTQAPGSGAGPSLAAAPPGPTERLPPRHPADAVGHVQPGPDPLLHPVVPALHGVRPPPQEAPSSGTAGPWHPPRGHKGSLGPPAPLGPGRPRSGRWDSARGAVQWPGLALSRPGALWLEAQLRARSGSSQSLGVGGAAPSRLLLFLPGLRSCPVLVTAPIPQQGQGAGSTVLEGHALPASPSSLPTPLTHADLSRARRGGRRVDSAHSLPAASSSHAPRAGIPECCRVLPGVVCRGPCALPSTPPSVWWGLGVERGKYCPA